MKLGLTILLPLNIVCLACGDLGLCANTEVRRATLPGGEMEAVLFERSCGATTGFSTQVSLVRRGAALPEDGGNVLVLDGHPDDTRLVMNWRADTLVISGGTGHDIVKSNRRVGAVHIRYDRSPR